MLAPFKTLANSRRSREEILDYARTAGASSAFAKSLTPIRFMT